MDYTKGSRTLVESLISGDLAGVRSLYTSAADIDDPFAGRQIDGGFESMVRRWGPTQHAKIVSTEVLYSTVVDKHVGTEFELMCEKPDGASVKVGMVAVSDIGATGKFDRTRLYYRRAMFDGAQHWRERLFGDPMPKMSYAGQMKAYHESLIAGDLETMLSTFADDAYFDGHGGALDLSKGMGMGRYEGKAAIRGVLDQMFSIMRSEGGKGANLKHHVAFSDGKVTVVEFTIVHPNHPLNRVTGGVACYELNDQGYLKAARIYDEAW